jgi:hypothetical protein
LRFLALRGATRISNPRVIEFDFWLSIDEKPWADRAWLVYPDRVDGVRSLYRLSAKVSPEGGIRISTVLNISKIASRNGLWALFSPSLPAEFIYHGDRLEPGSSGLAEYPPDGITGTKTSGCGGGGIKR